MASWVGGTIAKWQVVLTNIAGRPLQPFRAYMCYASLKLLCDRHDVHDVTNY